MSKDAEKIEELYHQALAKPKEERTTFLVEACGGDETLHRELQSMLDALERADEVMELPALEHAARLAGQAGSQMLAGHQLGPFRIGPLLGRGGMGEVYRAVDTRLDRPVAIKILPNLFAGVPERLARFEREAKLLASLNHPNIAAIHGLEEAEGKRFLVLELVEGKTLAERLSRKPLPIDVALRICSQIAEGLEAAHEKGIIHRDLKPANVKIDPEGKVKILDFGLAKVYQPEGSSRNISESSTLTAEMTREGVIFGTAAYMSPEQATGKPVDKRADIWAFGCLLFECLTGRQAFQGGTVTETLAAILKGEPDWQALPAATPWKVKELLHRCLQKDPRDRLHDIADARIEIGESLGQSLDTVARSFHTHWLMAGTVFTLFAGVLIVYLVKITFRANPSLPVVRVVIKMEPGRWLDGMRWQWERPTRTAVAISKDGRFIVYSASAITEKPGPQTKPQLYLRRTDQLEAKPIAGTEGGINPFLSPDDRWVGFWAGGKLMKVPNDGGVPVPLCDMNLPFGASWGPDNSIIFSPDENSGLFRVSAEGGDLESLTTPDKTKEEVSHRLPHCLPDGRGALFTIMKESNDLQPRIAWLDLQTRKWLVLMVDAADARYIPTGHLVFLRQGTLMVLPFNLGKHEVVGQPVPIVANIMQAINAYDTRLNTAAGHFSISDSGWLVYAEGGINPDPETSLVWVDQKGDAQPIIPFRAAFFSPRFSPDGQQIAFTTIGRERQVWVYDLNRGTTSRLTGEGKVSFVTWTPNGKRVVFDWNKSGQPNLCWQSANGSTGMERLTASDQVQIPGSWSPDGTTLAFVEGSDINLDIFLLDLQSRRITPYLNSRANEGWPEFSPDGRWMAYQSNESGRYEVYVRPFPGPGGKWLISQEGGREPLWARDGKQLFYRNWEQSQVWVVDVAMNGGFTSAKPRLLFKSPGLGGGGTPIRGWDLSRDGQRFLMVRNEEMKPAPVTELVLVQNLFEELRRLALTGKK
jgi:eukaryotic-like serine/threonine-protein kinase